MKRPIYFLVPFIFLLGCAVNRPPEVVPTTGAIKGIVVDAHHMGIGSTSIILLSAGAKPQQLASILTDDNGNFILSDLAPGEGMTVNAIRNGTAKIMNTPQGMTVIKSGLIESGSKINVPVVAGKITDVGEIELTAHAK